MAAEGGAAGGKRKEPEKEEEKRPGQGLRKRPSAAAPTALRLAVREKLVPKARRPFALFVTTRLPTLPEADSQQDKVKALSAQWRVIPAE